MRFTIWLIRWKFFAYFCLNTLIILYLGDAYLMYVIVKAPNATNSLCGYKIVTGQPSDRLGEDFSELYKDFTER